MRKPDILELWIGDSTFLRMETSVRLTPGDLISIRQTTYRVVAVSLAIDYADEVFGKQFRQNATIEEVKPSTPSTDAPERRDV